MNTEIYNWAKENLKPEDGGWLAGLVAGEGCFSLCVTKRKTGNWQITPVLQISLRTDDRGALEEVKRLWQIGNKLAYDGRTAGTTSPLQHPVFQLRIVKNVILRNRVIPTFRLYPLRAKKQRDFEIWAEAVEILYQKRITKTRFYKLWEIERLQEIAAAVKAGREWVPPERRE